MKTSLSKKIINITDSISLKTKIIAIFFAFIIVPLVIFTFISYSRINKLVLSQTLNSATKSFNECTSILDKYFNNMNNAMQNMLFDETIYNIASKDTADYAPIHQLQDFKALMTRFDYVQKVADIDSIRFYIDIDSYYSENNINIFSLSKVENLDWYKNLISTDTSRIWAPPFVLEEDRSGQGYFTYARILFSLESLRQPLAVLKVDIDSAKVDEALKNAVITENSVVFITDGRKILWPEQMESKVNINIAKRAIEISPSQWEFIQFNNTKFIACARRLKLMGWYAVAVIPQSDIIFLQNEMKNDMILVLVILATISYFLAFVTAHSSLKRIFLLNSEMKKLESGNFKTSLKQIGRDEIGELMGSFNKMAARMSELIEEQYIMGQEMKNSELKALQAQINPHFLYNSLDLINCLAIKYNIPEITQMVTSLAKFYKLSLSQGNDVIPLKDELMHVSLYVQIQNLRFDNKIKLIMNYEEWVSEYSSLKTILQPIVENSIIHGIFEKEEISGTITISIYMEGGSIILEVADDGVGMPEELVEKILIEDKSSRRHGYGVKNTNDRIKLFYGQEYGLSYSSILGKGTTVRIRIPAVKYNAAQ